MSKRVKCPHCEEIIDYFEHIGDMSNRRCPACKKSISDEEAEKAEVVEE